ncbi:ATP-dependent helicase [Pajaroellobacter abortibovis]|uniref:DNA 3'-5' helicase n=1 Tax=Pajaroellobacter abortibovis TaxID=1882918 RepID=A0A1L6MVA6_9BACT|nr:UvrD-helicase domain-containing protein [Pajaroellobacter abortibovis]APR99448.1 hypothetical protein BCY86_01195 [Pajaroellobacter abortibovis]
MLNSAQTQAVEHHHGPLLVLAVAGSGKTRILTHRIARLLEYGIPPHAILALTFTNKAAYEMRERIGQLLRSREDQKSLAAMTISTFHAFGMQVLRTECNREGKPFTIFDQGDVLSTLKDLLRNTKLSLDPSLIAARISLAKNAFLSPSELPDSGVDVYEETTKLLFPRYQTALRNFGAYDFDDLVCETVRMWQHRPDLLAFWQERFRFILVDEYQDTNRSQFKMLHLLAQHHQNLCAVGDDDQSIYGWRGANINNILDFETHFPRTLVVKLEQNYRSSPAIIAVANAIIAQRKDTRHHKILFTQRLEGEPVQCIVAPSPEAEARFIAEEIQRFRDKGEKPAQIAVLYRSNNQSRQVEETLRELSIPYRILGGQKFFERKEVKDLLAYMKLALAPSDEISLRRVINYPTRGLGEANLEKLSLFALIKGWSLMQAVSRAAAIPTLSSSARQGCEDFLTIIRETQEQLHLNSHPPSHILRNLANRIELKKDLFLHCAPQVAARRWKHVENLFHIFEKREQALSSSAPSARQPPMNLLAFVHALTLDFPDEEEDHADKVTLSTLHASKGLEFNVVFLIGCEEGLLPHSRVVDTPSSCPTIPNIEEERRLFYVGVTRARSHLFISRAKQRMLRNRAIPKMPSRFLQDLPSSFVITREIDTHDPSHPIHHHIHASELLDLLNQL